MRLNGLTVGIPREIMPGEKRVAATPETVQKMKEAGAKVLVETGAGENSFFNDEDYIDRDAEIVKEPSELFGHSDIVLKVKEPSINDSINKHEVELMKENSHLICFLHPANPSNHETVKLLADRNITSFTLDSIPRISRAQQMDALTSMSTAAGYKTVILAAYHLARFIPMMPTATGVIPPAEFLVVGTGVVGLQAIGMAKRLGAKVKAVDIRNEANEQAKSLGAEIIPFEVPQELATGEGGYAKRLPDEWYEKERELLAPYIKESDAIILSALIPGEISPQLVKKDSVVQMKKGSVIVDIAVDQGGNCELTKPGEEYEYNGVTISGLKNLPADLAVDATSMFSQNVWQFLSYISEDGKIKTDKDDEVIKNPLVTINGEIVHEGTLNAMKNS
ncbi:NAD(P) transhydrogenase subunit alpha [Natranaerofaba carboxydovora]|uniref:NAD(P) transhydrogenase subunit alpha n=1 Tax=Natranaerofaba carboxydovora TaxID=2742683 RepID=UPI001F14301B|nr:NAD(P) transhydrogenase subunit alpha [Natranaerofaba carboxydovora]UMZ73652.1 NAD(P) transhydrogenase subunit alpha [Natranaerofaba carboxydovora]